MTTKSEQQIELDKKWNKSLDWFEALSTEELDKLIDDIFPSLVEARQAEIMQIAMNTKGRKRVTN